MGLFIGRVIYTAVKPIFKIYMIIGVGIFLTKKNILTAETEKNLSSIAINVLLPCLAFQKIVSNISNDDIHQIATIVIISFFMMGVGSILCFGFGVVAKCPRSWWGGLICCGLLPNISDLPIAYLQTMETSNIFNDIDKGVSYVMIYLTLQMLVQFNFGAFKLIEMDFHTEAMLDAREKKEHADLEKDEVETIPQLSVIDDDGDDPNHPERPPQTVGIHSLRGLADATLSSLSLVPSHPTEQAAHSSDSTLSSLSSLSSSIDSSQVPNRNTHSIPVLTVPPGNTPKRNTSNVRLAPSMIPNLKKLGTPVRRKSTRSTIADPNMVTEPLSRTLSVPQMLYTNEQLNEAPETMQDIVRVYSKYQVLEPIKHDFETSTKEAKTLFRKVIELLKTTNYLNLIKSILKLWMASMMKPVSISMVLSITVCMIPWVQALFVVTHQAHLPNAPDGDPPLSFIIDFAGYLGAAEVPIGLLLLGGTIGRLDFMKIPFRVWKVPIGVAFARLFIMPIIGCAFNSKLHKDGLFYSETILYFISNINFCLPPATSLLYITAFYTPIDDKPHLQMDYLALVYILHYIFLVVCLPFTTTYTMKVPLNL